MILQALVSDECRNSQEYKDAMAEITGIKAQPLNPRQAAWFRALDHARSTGVLPHWHVGDYYSVTSPGSGKRYIIRRHGQPGHLEYRCECPAYSAGHVCWHRALVMALPYEVKLRGTN